MDDFFEDVFDGPASRPEQDGRLFDMKALFSRRDVTESLAFHNAFATATGVSPCPDTIAAFRTALSCNKSEDALTHALVAAWPILRIRSDAPALARSVHESYSASLRDMSSEHGLRTAIKLFWKR